MKSILRKIIERYHQPFSSAQYWETRYRSGGNSGMGSYNQLSEFKAKFINEFNHKHSIRTAIEFGCGDGHQLNLIRYPRYIGLDVSKTSISICAEKFKQDSSKSFFLYDPFSFIDRNGVFRSDLSLSLDVIYHLIENEVYELYMNHLFQSSSQYVMIYSTNFESQRVNHERNRQFTSWVGEHKPGWKLMEMLENPFKNNPAPELQSMADFFIYRKIQANE